VGIPTVTRRNQPVVGDSTVEPESGKLCHEFRYDPAGSEPLSTTLVRAIAEAREITPEEMDRPLQRSVDTDALDNLFHDRYDRSPSGVSLLSFRTYGLEVVIREGQQVTIYEVED
jgi:hypothetical protein